MDGTQHAFHKERWRFGRTRRPISGALLTAAVLLTLLPALAPPARAGSGARAGPWRWPLDGRPRVIVGFTPPVSPWGPGHRGVDLAARPGTPVHAAGPGRVAYAGPVAGRGVVAVTHGNLRTTYLPVRATVEVGERVDAGDRIGTLEGRRTHCAPQSCLHWGLLRGVLYLDPLSLLGGGPVRLLPVWGVPVPPVS